MGKLEHEGLTYKIRGAIFEVYNILGPGFKEIVYHNSLQEEFDKREIKYDGKKKIKIVYKSKQVGIYEPDFIVEDKIIIEIKAVNVMPKVFEEQLYGYLKATKYKVGILVNFSGEKLDIRRRIYG
ncbi:MAG: GxxExxY protein [Spirochaetes bacterium]|nr:MAG: GxxExxY protein [Spirochaetota bacterium]